MAFPPSMDNINENGCKERTMNNKLFKILEPTTQFLPPIHCKNLSPPPPSKLCWDLQCLLVVTGLKSTHPAPKPEPVHEEPPGPGALQGPQTTEDALAAFPITSDCCQSERKFCFKRPLGNVFFSLSFTQETPRFSQI